MKNLILFLIVCLTATSLQAQTDTIERRINSVSGRPEIRENGGEWKGDWSAMVNLPPKTIPIANAAELETILQGKLHGVYVDGITDQSSNNNNNTNELAPAPVNADGSLSFVGNASRIAINTNGANSGVSIFASIRPAIAQFSVFGGSSSTFIPLASNAAGSDVSRLDGVSNVPFSINGVSGFVNRIAVHSAMPQTQFSKLEVSDLANGTSITIGDHQTNNSFSFIGDLARMVVVNDTLNDSQRLAVESFLEYGFTEEADDGVVFADSPTGIYRICVLEDDVNIGTTNTTVLTNCDLTQPDLYIEFEYSDNGGEARAWQTGRLRVAKIIERFNAGDTVDGYNLVFDNDFVIINLVDVATGEFALRYSGRDIGVTHAEVYQLAQKAPSRRVGEFVHAKSGKTTSQGYLAVNPGTITNGATDYPLWAAMYPEFVNGNDILFPIDVADMIIRNVNGNSEPEGEFQPFATNVDGITVTDPTVTGRQTNRRTGGSNAAYPSTTNVNRTLQGGATETRMNNRSYQLYAIVDTYVDVGVGGSIELGPNATTRGITLTGNVLETPIGFDQKRGRYELKGQATVGQPALNGQFPFSEAGLTYFSSAVKDNGDNTYTITTQDSPWTITADTKTDSITGDANRISYIHEVGTPDANRLANATDGRFGNAQPDISAVATIPANTTITIDVRSVSSGGSQRLTAGASLDFAELEEITEAWKTLQANFDFNSTTYVEIPDLKFAVEAGETWKFDFAVQVVASDTASDLRLQIKGPGTLGIVAYQNVEGALSRSDDFGNPSANIAMNLVPDNINADVIHVEGWLTAATDGEVTLDIRNNAGTLTQTVGARSWVEAELKLAN